MYINLEPNLELILEPSDQSGGKLQLYNRKRPIKDQIYCSVTTKKILIILRKHSVKEELELKK